MNTQSKARFDPEAEKQMALEIVAESIGWQPLEQGAYLHLGGREDEEAVITVVGVPETSMASANVLLLVV